MWASASAFYNDVDDLISIALDPDAEQGETMIYQYVNIASARTRGVETRLRVMPLDGLTIDAGYALTDTLDRSENRPLPGRARHRITGLVRYRHQPWGLSAQLRGSFTGARLFFADEAEIEAEPYTSLDGRVAQDVTRFLTAFAGVDNVLDAGDPSYLPIAPRTFYGGLTARY